jgi:hypothetical protein
VNHYQAPAEGAGKQTRGTLGAVSWRVHNPADVVPYVPPFFIGFKHTGESLHLSLLSARLPPLGPDAGGAITRPPAVGQKPTLLQRLADLFRSPTGLMRSTVGYNPVALYVNFLLWTAGRPGEHMMDLYVGPFAGRQSFSALPVEPEYMKREPPTRESNVLWLIRIIVSAGIVAGGYWIVTAGGEVAMWGLVFAAMIVVYTIIDHVSDA